MAIICTIRCYFFIIATVVFTVYISHCSVEKEWQHTVIINSFKGTKNEMCYDSGRPVQPPSNQITCEDINAGFQFRNSSTMFILRPGIHYLSSSVLFNSVNQLAIVGDNGSNSTVVCRIGTGFSFINSTDITLQWVTYLGCGVLQNSTSKNFSTDARRKSAADLKVQVGLYFYQCHGVVLDHLTIANSSSNGLTMYETTGNITVMNSIFCDNSLGSNRSGGGGGEVSVNSSFWEPAAGTTGLNQSHSNSILQELDTVESPAWRDVWECPPGLTVPANTASNDTCQCPGPDSYGGQVKCSIVQDGNDYNDEVDVRNGIWIGNISDSNLTLFVGDCFYYCRANNKGNFYSLQNVSMAELDSYVCGVNHRTGVLCGECVEGYGPAVNTWDFSCVACNDSGIARRTVKYFFTTYVPLFFLFLAIIVFKVRLTTGLHAFVLYAQMISSAFDVSAAEGISLNTAFSKHEIQRLLGAYYFVYGIFNLEFFSYLLKPYCLTQSFNNLDILQLQYGVALFPLIMIIAVFLFLKLNESGFFSRCTRRFQSQTTNTPEGEGRVRSGWRFTDNLLHAFVAFTLLSYTKFTTSSTFILTLTTLFGEDGKPVEGSRVYLAGQYRIDQKEYFHRYALPATIVLTIFVALPPFLLLGPLQWFNQLVVPRVSCLQRYWPSVKVNIVLDAFQGCYKPHARFFAGLYFLFRVAVLANYGATPSPLDRYIIQQILATVMVALLAIFQPYQRRLFNYVDTLIFLNMAIINSLNILIFTSYEINSQTPFPMAAFIVLYILIYLPLVYMIGYILYYFVINYRKKVAQQLNLWYTRCCCQKTRRSSQPLLDAASKDFQRSKYGSLINDASLFARAKEINTFQPSLNADTASAARTAKDEDGNSGSKYPHFSDQDSGVRSRSANATPTSTQSMEDTRDSLPNGNDLALHISQLEQ